MGRAAREKPARLANKLLAIRTALRLSQSEMLARLELEEEGYRHYVSEWELGKREPPLIVILRYANLANVVVNALIDDKIELPKSLPARPSFQWSLNWLKAGKP